MPRMITSRGRRSFRCGAGGRFLKLLADVGRANRPRAQRDQVRVLRRVERQHRLAPPENLPRERLGPAADLGVRDEAGLLYARSRLVVATRAAGLPGPVQSVYTNVRDEEGLRRSTEEGKKGGFVGRSAIHPNQLSTINEVFTPTEREIAEAEELLTRLKESAGSGTGAFALEDGRFVDEAVVGSARLTLALARRDWEEVS